METNQISIYFHWPFCESKCPYCDFNSYVRNKINHKEWLNAYLNNIDFWKEKLDNSVIRSIYFGGGTPSLMNPHYLSLILEKIYKNFSLSKELEISLEANPSSVEKKKFKDFSLAGINRISIGVQSFNDIDLKYLGRKHSANDALDAVEIANSEFVNVNFDFIYGRQFQTLASWNKELNFALSLGSQHLSLYQLTIENGTAFKNLYNVGKLKGLPNQKLSKEFGIQLVDVRIKRINYVDEVQQKVFSRMISERKQIAAKYQSEGEGEAANIQGQMQKDLEEVHRCIEQLLIENQSHFYPIHICRL